MQEKINLEGIKLNLILCGPIKLNYKTYICSIPQYLHKGNVNKRVGLFTYYD